MGRKKNIMSTVCEVAKALADNQGTEIKCCAECPWYDECVRNEDPEIPF